MKKIICILIVASLIISFGMMGTTNSNIENLIIPETYEDLLSVYKDVADIAVGYQRLYNESEQALTESESDNEALMEIIKNLQSLIDTQQDIINKLLNKNRFSIFTGLNFVPLKPAYSGIMAGINFEW